MSEPFQLHLSVRGGAALRVVRLRAREALNEPYLARVTVVSPDPAAFGSSVIGASATLVTDLANRAARRTQGIVTGSRLARRGPEGGAVELVIEPRMCRLRLRQRKRVFQDKTAWQITDDLFSEHGCIARSEVMRPLSVRPYTVQYDESDYAFVARLLADEGLFYFFEQPERDVTTDGADPPIETVVVADLVSSYPKAAPIAQLSYRADELEGTVQTDDTIYRVRLERAAALERVDLEGLDFKRPSTTIADQAESVPKVLAGPDAPLERVTHELSWETVPSAPGPAFVELEQHRRETEVLSARTAARHLTPGSVFTLSESLEPDLIRDWVVVACDHRGASASRGGRGEGSQVYEGRFRAVPANVAYRPSRPAKPAARGVETAMVVGPPGEAVYVDDLGRIRVRFPWERETGPDENATTWLRVAQPWGGATYGTQFIPRVGSQVLVDFIGGDPDRPIVIGSVYDVERGFPYVLPEKRTKSGIRTSTVGGAGSNEIAFEDRAGQELLSIRGERNVFVGAGDGYSQQVGGSQTVEVGGDAKNKIGGAVEEEIGGARKTTIAGSIVEDTANASIQRRGSQVLNVAGSRYETASGAMETRVGGAHQLLVGTSAKSFSMTVVQGTATTRSSETMTLTSDAEIVLRVGDSVLSIGPSKIVMTAPEVLVASPDVKVHGKDGKEYIELGGGVRAKADSISLHAKASALLLNGGAKLEGSTIALSSMVEKAPDREVSSTTESGVVTFEFQNLDPTKKSTAMVLMPSGKVEEHPISGGTLQLEGRPGERFSLVDLRVDGVSVAKSKA